MFAHLTSLDCEFHCIFVAGVCVRECECMCVCHHEDLLDLMNFVVQGQRNHIPKVWVHLATLPKCVCLGKIVLTIHASTSPV